MSLLQIPWLDEFIPSTIRLLITAGALALAGYVLWRSKTSRYWREERDAAIARAERFEKEKEEIKTEKERLEKELTALQAKTDVSPLQMELSAAIKLNQSEHKEIIIVLKEIQGGLTEIARILMRSRENA